jgi:hypothetical protein
MMEIKKRGDLARQLCSSKDEEIRQLREKLHYDQKHHHPSTSPVSKSKKGLQPSTSGASLAQEAESAPGATPVKTGAVGGAGDSASTPLATHSALAAGGGVGCDGAMAAAEGAVGSGGDGNGQSNGQAKEGFFVELELEEEENEDDEVRATAPTTLPATALEVVREKHEYRKKSCAHVKFNTLYSITSVLHNWIVCC